MEDDFTKKAQEAVDKIRAAEKSLEGKIPFLTTEEEKDDFIQEKIFIDEMFKGSCGRYHAYYNHKNTKNKQLKHYVPVEYFAMMFCIYSNLYKLNKEEAMVAMSRIWDKESNFKKQIDANAPHNITVETLKNTLKDLLDKKGGDLDIHVINLDDLGPDKGKMN